MASSAGQTDGDHGRRLDPDPGRVINLLAQEGGAEEGCSERPACWNGSIDFEESLRERVSLLKGLDQTAITRVQENITLTSGAHGRSSAP